MNFLIALCIVAASLLLPWWCVAMSFLVFGFALRLSWKSSAGVALCVAALEIALAAYFDVQAQGLISQRVAGVFLAPPWVAIALPGLLGAWMSFFGCRFGSAVRGLVAKS